MFAKTNYCKNKSSKKFMDGVKKFKKRLWLP